MYLSHNYCDSNLMCHSFLLKRYMNVHILGINLTYAIIWDVEKSLRQVLYHIQMHLNLFYLGCFCPIIHIHAFMLTNRIWSKKSCSNTHW